MAIVINGSGTLSGLAVGGLPDGTVDAGTLATNSVDSAELIDGAVDNSHMAAMAASKLTGDIAAARMPAGSVLQVVNAIHSTDTQTTSASPQDTGLTAAITPSSTSSKILVVLSQNGVFKHTGNAATAVTLKLYKGSSNIGTFGTNSAINYDVNNYAEIGTVSFNYLDSPSTTSATTYKTTYNSTVNGQTVQVQRGSSISSITLLEIAG